MAADVIGAVVEVWAADAGPGSLAVLVPGGLWLGEVPGTLPGGDPLPLPHASLEHDQTTDDLESEPGKGVETTKLRLTVWVERDVTASVNAASRPAEALGVVTARARSVLNAGTLDVDGADHMDLRVTGYKVRSDANRAADTAGRVWVVTMDVFALIGR